MIQLEENINDEAKKLFDEFTDEFRKYLTDQYLKSDNELLITKGRYRSLK